MQVDATHAALWCSRSVEVQAVTIALERFADWNSERRPSSVEVDPVRVRIEADASGLAPLDAERVAFAILDVVLTALST